MLRGIPFPVPSSSALETLGRSYIDGRGKGRNRLGTGTFTEHEPQPIPPRILSGVAPAQASASGLATAATAGPWKVAPEISVLGHRTALVPILARVLGE